MYSEKQQIYFEWLNDPEPMKNSLDGRVILDAGIGGSIWLYNSMQESTEYLVYQGQAADVER